MDGLLLITDDLRRGQRLARELGHFYICRVHELYDEFTPTDAPTTVVSDIADLSSEAILRLRRVLARGRDKDIPYLFLMHGNVARAEAQARALGASSTQSAGALTQALLTAVQDLQQRSDRAASVAGRRAETARRFLADVFVPGGPITPTTIDNGTGVVAEAIREAGVREWVRAVQRFDNNTHRHCLLVAGLAAAFARGLGLTAIDCHQLTKAALLHDVGKIHVPPTILNKPDRLTEAEMKVMRLHPTQGEAMLAGRGFKEEMLTVVRSHHELLDGSGYPDQLTGAQIPDLVRLVTVCDIYAALIERRSYKPSMPGVKAYGILAGMRGQLDADLVRAFRPVAVAFDPAATKAA